MINEKAEQTNMDKITTDLAEFICDKVCIHPKNVSDTVITQDELEDICAECEMSKHICNVLNEYNGLNEFDNTRRKDKYAN